MPLTRVFLLKGKPPEYRQAILDGLYQAMREAFDMPDGDRFMLIEEYDRSNFVYGESYLGIRRYDVLLIIQTAVNNTRGPIKRRHFMRASRNSSQGTLASARKTFFLMSLLEVPKENWLFGNGIAQYA
ncbi:MAG: tautomerase family protein [Methylocella sp.]